MILSLEKVIGQKPNCDRIQAARHVVEAGHLKQLLRLEVPQSREHFFRVPLNFHLGPYGCDFATFID